MKSPRKVVIDEINITPLTDIFLVLLIIMIVVAPMLEYPGLKLSVPSIGPDVETKEPPKTVNVMIDEEDQYFVEERRVDKFALVQTIRQLSREKQDGLVIQTHPDASHDAMTQVMDAAQKAGVTKLAVTEMGKE